MTSTFLSRLMLAVAILAGAVAAVQADTTVDKLNAYMQAVVRVRAFSGSVLVSKDGNTLMSKGYGLANAEHDVPNTPATKFRIGSLTKQFTAMAVMLLVERDKLSVDDPISNHMPNVPEAWKDVTIHNLLTHTSGIPSYTGMLQYRLEMMLPRSTDQMIARFRDLPLEFTVGERYHYSNSGYFLLGVIIENVSGMSYEDFLRKEICDPLGMKDTGYDHYRRVLKNRASGYSRGPDGVRHARYLDMSQPYSAGSLYSTVEDLKRWDDALRQCKLLSKQGFEKLYTPFKDNYAYGWHIDEMHGHTTISHGGGINGFTSFILRIPDESLCVIALSNVQQVSTSSVANDLVAIVLGEEYELPASKD